MNGDYSKISLIQNGNRSIILETLKSDKLMYKIPAFVSIVKNEIIETEILKELKRLKDDNRKLLNTGNTVADWAIAALDLLEIEKFNGERDEIIRLINSKMDL